MIAVTVDVEDWYHVPAVTGSPFARYATVDDFFKQWTGRYDYLTAPTHRVLDLLDEYDVTATFFVVADVTEHYPGLVQSIASRGHEIACHGLHHACKIHPKTKKPLMSPQEFRIRTSQAKDMLEQATGQSVVGYRAPAAYVGGWMLPVLAELGFRYDSSVCANSIFNKTDSSLTGVGSIPYSPRNGTLLPGGNGPFYEVPLSHLRVGVTLPTSGGPFLRFLGARYLMMGIQQSLRRGDTVMYFHPIDISDEAFPSGFSKQRPFYWAIKGSLVEDRLRDCLTRLREHEHGLMTDIVARVLQNNSHVKQR